MVRPPRPDYFSATESSAVVRPRVRLERLRASASHSERGISEQLSRLFPVVVLVGVGSVLSWKTSGSIEARDWLPYAVIATLVLAGTVVAGGARPNRLCGRALALLVAFAAWTALSLTWAPIPSLARDDALLALLYAIALAVGILTLRTADDRFLAGGAVAAGAALTAVISAFRLRVSGHPASSFIDGRLDFPISYTNAQAAAALLGFWPATVVAARRSAPVVVRAAAVATATALLCDWLLTQSKGGALGLGVSAAVVLAVSETRLRLVLPALLAGAVAALGVSPLTAPIRATNAAQLAASIRHAGTVLLLLTALGALAGAGYAALDRRVRLRSRTTELARRAALAAVAAAALACAVLLATHAGRLWSDFRQQSAQPDTSSHLVSLGSNRFDFWRVALHEFERHPFAGIGARGFETAYLSRRRSDETPARSHSLEADVLSETGIVGGALLGASLLLLLVAAWRRARLEPAAAGLLGASTCVLAHASVDWIWAFPAVGVPLFVVLGAGASAGRGHSSRLSLPTASLVSVGILGIGLFAFGGPWLAARYEARAQAGGPGALADARRSATLDPLSVDPLLTESQLAPGPRAALPPLQAAVRREPRNYALHYLLASGYYRVGEIAFARSELRRAHALNPRDPIVAAAISNFPQSF